MEPYTPRPKTQPPPRPREPWGPVGTIHGGKGGRGVEAGAAPDVWGQLEPSGGSGGRLDDGIVTQMSHGSQVPPRAHGGHGDGDGDGNGDSNGTPCPASTASQAGSRPPAAQPGGGGGEGR